jgi:hypothetical protein
MVDNIEIEKRESHIRLGFEEDDDDANGQTIKMKAVGSKYLNNR